MINTLFSEVLEGEWLLFMYLTAKQWEMFLFIMGTFLAFMMMKQVG